MSTDIVFAAPDWSLEEAAVTMVRHGFRHLVVVSGAEIAGVLSMRDVVRCWTDDGSSCELPRVGGAAVSARRRQPSRAALRRGDERAGRELGDLAAGQ